MDDLKKELELDVHKITVAELCQRLGTNIEMGLTESQAKANLERDNKMDDISWNNRRSFIKRNQPKLSSVYFFDPSSKAV